MLIFFIKDKFLVCFLLTSKALFFLAKTKKEKFVEMLVSLFKVYKCKLVSTLVQLETEFQTTSSTIHVLKWC